MTNFAIRINNPGSFVYWSNNSEHGGGWRSKIDHHTTYTFEGALGQLRVIRETLSDLPELTLVPVPLPKIEVYERDASALAEAIRLAMNATGSLSFRDELRGILDRLTPPQAARQKG